MVANSYVPKEGLEALKQYSYHCVDQSILCKLFLQRFWNWIILFVPTSIAPNLLTLIGLLHTLAGYSVLVYYAGDSLESYGVVPTWAWIFATYCTFIYQTLDAIDGKQARRTGSSSPLGELFDHGCDAISSVFTVLSLSIMLRLDTYWTMLAFMTLLNVFFMANWEEYFTGEMFMGYLNVTEGQVLMMCVYAATAAFGQDYWSQRTLFADALGYGRVSAGRGVLLFSFAGALASAVVYVASVVKHQGRHVFESLALLAPLALTTSAVTVWCVWSPTRLFQRRTHTVLLGAGMLYANLVGKVVLARVMRLRYEPSQWLLLLMPLLVCAANARVAHGGWFDERRALPFFVLWSVVAYAHFSYNVISAITAHLGINCLTLTEAQLAAIAAKAKASGGKLSVPPTPGATHRYGTRSKTSKNN